MSDEGTRLLWIGLNDAAEEGTFVWSSGETVTYTNWYDGQPTSPSGPSGEDYVQMGYFTSYQWNDLHETNTWFGATVNGVVELNATAVPEPSTLVLSAFGFGGIVVARWKRRRKKKWFHNHLRTQP